MGVLDVLRKGLGYALMSMGVSSPAPKAKAAQNQPPQNPAAQNPTGKPDSGASSGA
jgi:hypothetical protein